MRNKVTLVVNSCDSYSDAWKPYFQLLAAFWKEREIDAVLNTESKELPKDHGLVRVCHTPVEGKAGAWSERLLQTLSRIQTPYVIYVQEDYFLKAPVDAKRLEEFLEVMEESEIDCMRLRETGQMRKYLTFEPFAENELFVKVPKKHSYYATTQVALWRKKALESIVKSGESVWEFERNGTRRARKLLDVVVCPNPKHFENWDSGIYPYEPTGIVRGQWWRPAVEKLFAEQGIEVDFTKRGFYEPSSVERFKQKLRSRLRRVFMKL